MPPKSSPTAASSSTAAAATTAAAAAPEEQQDSILQTVHTSLQPPKSDEQWSTWYAENEDAFRDFKSYEPAATGKEVPASGGSVRTLSARQISGQFDDEVAKSWEEDWEDEDVEDTFDYIMGQVSRIEASRAAAVGQN